MLRLRLYITYIKMPLYTPNQLESYRAAWNDTAPIAFDQVLGRYCSELPERQREPYSSVAQTFELGHLTVSHASDCSPLQVTFHWSPDQLSGIMPFWSRNITYQERCGIPEEAITALGGLWERVAEGGQDFYRISKVLQAVHKAAVDKHMLRQPRLAGQPHAMGHVA